MILKMKVKSLLPLFWFFLVGFLGVSAQRCGETGDFIPHDKYDPNRHLLFLLSLLMSQLEEASTMLRLDKDLIAAELNK